MAELHRAWAVLQVKEADTEARILRGVATTPAVDRDGDIIEPLGLTFRNPLPLLWQHDARQPIGTVTMQKPTAKGIEFEAHIPIVAEAGALRDRIEEAWQSVKHGLVTGASIGYKPAETSLLKSGGYRILKAAIWEMSLVTIPANSEAIITAIKSVDLRANTTPAGDNKREPCAKAASGQQARIVRLHESARVGAPFIIKKIRR